MEGAVARDIEKTDDCAGSLPGLVWFRVVKAVTWREVRAKKEGAEGVEVGGSRGRRQAGSR